MRRVFNDRVQILDSNGDTLVGAKLEFFAAGTANNEDTFTDFDLTTANTNPVITDSGGWCTIFLTPNTWYDYTVLDSNDVTVYPKMLDILAYEPPLTTKGDLFTFDTDFQRLGVGADGLVLKADSAEPTGLIWGDGSGGSPLTTKGDLYGYDTDDARLPVGNDGAILLADSGEATGLKWVHTNVRAVTGDAVSLTGDTWVTIVFDTETEDSDAIHDNATYTTTIAIAGWYAISVQGVISSSDSNNTHTRINWTPNGGSVVYLGIGSGAAGAGALTFLHPVGLWTGYMTAGDTVSVSMKHVNTTKSLAAGALYNIRRFA